uniref:Receptor expression-enhancing protein n=1 Tax=Schistocephalus solidus TaxID=70667 RepID=A0A0X3Q439_SCHSO
MIAIIFSRAIIIAFGVLLPAYKSYKALKYRNVKNMVRLTMHWIVFSIFLAIETVTDYVLTWFPFYYELKVFLVLYLALPFTQGSSIIYRKVIHPHLSKRETDIDEALLRATETGYSAVMQFGAKGLTYAASTVLTTAMKGQDLIANHINQRSYSMDDLWRDRRPIDRLAAGDSAQESMTPRQKTITIGDSSSRSLRSKPPSVRRQTVESHDLYDVSERDEEERPDSSLSIDSGDAPRSSHAEPGIVRHDSLRSRKHTRRNPRNV